MVNIKHKINPILLFLLFFIGLIICYQSAYSQNFCGSDSLHQILLNTDEAYKAKTEQFEKHWQNYAASQHNKSKKKSTGPIIRVVPVVFHIIHDNGPENIPDSIVYEQIDILNECFRKIPGTIGDGAGVDTKIEFCLATIDPNGNQTTGITRSQSPCTDALQPGCGFWGSNIIFWGDSVREYLQIWIYRNFGVLGLGSPHQVMIRYDAIGRNGLYNGRAVVHEIAHSLGLRHTFSGGCGGDCTTSGDYICDTPPVASPNYGCPTGINSCSNDVPDLPDLVENYMDYSQNCANMFTQGQKDRMYNWLQVADLASGPNLQNTGCYLCDTIPCPPIADFKEDKTLAAVGGSINFTDFSYSIPTSWQWSFPGGTPSFSTTQNPIVRYDTSGTYSVTLIVTNAAGSDTMIKNNYINIVTQQWRGVGDGLGCGGGVQHLIVYNDELYAGNSFSGIAVWKDTAWLTLEAGVLDTLCGGGGNGSSVYSLGVYNNELYMSRDRDDSAGNFLGSYIEKWNGTDWSVIATDIRSWDMIVFNNELYLAEDNGLKKWDGLIWTTVASCDYIVALAVYNNDLYVGGDFDSINGINIKNIARFDGVNWYAVGGSGLAGGFWDTSVYVMEVYDSMLYIGGDFTSVDGVNADYIARWDGTNWYAVGSGLVNPWPWVPDPFALTVWNNKLYVGGVFDIAGGNSVNNIASWDGSSWMPVGTGTNNTVLSLEVWNNELYAGGFFTVAGDDTVNYIAKWGCPNLYVAFTQSADTVDLAAWGDVLFTNQSVNATKWYWDFGDGGTDTIQNPVHTYWQEGTYTVTLTAMNDTCANSAISTVVVKWDCYPIANVNYSQSTDTVDLAVSGNVTFYSNPDIISDSLIWDFGDGTTDTAQNPVHSYNSTGIYTVALTSFKDTCSVMATSTVVVVNSSGFEEFSVEDLGLRIYPNPNTGQFTLEMDLEKKTKVSIKLYQITGQQIFAYEINNIAGNYNQQIDMSKLAKGIYYVQFITDRGVFIKKLIYQ